MKMKRYTREIDEEGSKALQQYFASCSVIITSETPGFRHGTGIAVTYRGQHYVVTAAHVLDDEPNTEKILIVGMPDSTLREVPKQEIAAAFSLATHGPIKSSRGIHVTITRRLLDRRLGDIAALKIENAERHLPHTHFHNLSDQGETEVSEGTPLVICGFPWTLGLHKKHEIALFTYCAWQKTEAFPNPLIDNSNPLDPSIDFFTDFVPDKNSCDPGGMSGGGAWDIPKTKDGKLWAPNQTRLSGIQSGLYRGKKLLRLVKIERVLELLSSNQLMQTA